MFDDLAKAIREGIRKDMKEKFGLSDTESEQSSRILQDRFKELFSEEQLRSNIHNLKSYLQDLGAENGPLRERFNRETIHELIDKVGLSEETATRIKDLSFDRYAAQLRTSLGDLENKLGSEKVQDYLKRMKLEGSAREAMDNLNKLFKRDS